MSTDESKRTFSWDTLVALVTGLLVPLAIFYVGQQYTSSKDRTDKEQQKIDRVSGLIRGIASDSERERRVTIRYVRYLASTGQAPPDVIPALDSVIEEEPSSQDAREASAALCNFANSTEPSIKRAVSILPPRIFLQISREEQRSKAKEIADRLSESGWSVPGIELKPTDNTELRYFRDEDRAEAESIANMLRGPELPIKVTDAGAYLKTQNITARPRHFELWFGPGVLK